MHFMTDFHRTKFHPMYWEFAYTAARQSVCERMQVGAVIVTPQGLISTGHNGMPPGLPNLCETTQIIDPITGKRRGKTDPRVVHAEMNALKKMINQGVATQGCVLFTTLSPCFNCAKHLVGLGFHAVIYDVLHDCTEGIEHLIETGTPVYRKDEI